MKAPLLSPKAWETEGRYLTIQGRRVFVWAQNPTGEAAIILLHGFPTASWDWHRMALPLQEHYYVLAPDFLGFGFSDKPKRHRYTLTEQADICEAVLQQLAVPRVHVLAHDYGNTVAQELLARYQSRPETDRLQLLSVCFLNGGLFPETHRPKAIQRLLISPVGPLLTPFIGKSAMARTFRQIFGQDTQPTEEELDAYWQLVSHNDGKYVMPHLIRYMTERARNRDRWVGALEKANIPLRLIDGPEDPISGEHMVQRYEELVPQADVVRLPGIGHYPQMETPLQVLQHYRVFLEKQ